MSDLLDFSPPGQATFTLAGAKARFYDAGTTNARDVYTDQTETVAHPSPIVADANGIFAQAFASGGAVKVVVTRSDDSTGYTLDPCPKIAASGAAAGAVSFSPTVELPFDNVQDAIEGASASAASGFTPYGLGVTGSVALIADINATGTATGQYRFDNTTLGTFPTGVAAADTGSIRIERETAGSAWMWLYHDTTDRVFIRRMASSVWGAWRENITADIGATDGDILYRTSGAWTRLAKGTAGQLLGMNSGATAPSWRGGQSGAAPLYGVRAWVKFVGATGVVTAGGNVISVTRSGVGNYTVTFTTALPTADYVPSIITNGGTVFGAVGTPLTTGCVINTRDSAGSLVDPAAVFVSFVG